LHPVPSRPRPLPHHTGLLIAWLVGVLAVGYTTISIYVPSMPAIADYFQTSVGTVQLTLVVYMWAFAVAQLFYGPLSDRIGRIPAMMIGFAIYIAASIWAALATSVEMLIVARGVQAFGACAGPVISRAVLRDSFDRERSAQLMTYVGMAMIVAPAFAPVLGGYLQATFGWQSIFVFLTLLGVAMAAWTRFGLEETNRQRQVLRASPAFDMLRAFPAVMRARAFVLLTLQTGFGASALFTYTAGVPFFLIQVLGHAPDDAGWLMVIPIVFNFIGSVTASRLTPRLGSDRMVLFGSAMLVVGATLMLVLALAGERQAWAVLGPAALAYFGLAHSFPNASQGAIAPFARRAGTASGLNGFITMVMAAGAVFVAGWMQDGSALPMALVMAVAAWAALACIGLHMLLPKDAAAAEE
jgi:DHA1 family bicyclomycin/chloramphenicol resistance-like MFS transporter